MERKPTNMCHEDSIHSYLQLSAYVQMDWFSELCPSTIILKGRKWLSIKKSNVVFVQTFLSIMKPIVVAIK